MRKIRIHATPAAQQGVSLIVTLLIAVLLVLLVIYGAGVLVQDTRSAANDFRAREALTSAESGVEQGYSLMTANKKFIKAIGLDLNNDGSISGGNEVAWAACAASTAQCQPIRSDDRTNWQYLTINSALTNTPTAGTFTLFLLTPSTGDSSRLVYNIVAIGKSADSSSTSVVKQGVYFFPLLFGEIGAPVAAAGNIPLGGNFSIITNANGGGSGQALSAWTKNTSTITSTGSTDRCYVGEALSGGGCPSSSDLDKVMGAGLCDDDLCSDPNFPTDLFKFLFGVPKEQSQKIKDKAIQLTNCASLNSASSGLIWISGDCKPPGNVGTAADPVTLVVEGNMTLNASDQLYGFLYLFKYPTPATAPKLIANGNATIHGAVFANDNVDLQLTGGFVLKYDSTVLGNLKKGTSGRSLGRIAGSWSDVQGE